MTLCIGKYHREKISDKYLLLFLKNCGIILSAIRSRWGQRLGQEKAASENSNLRKAKVLEIRRSRGLLVRREGFEPPAFWSVGCLKGKSELFRLHFVLFTTVRSADFPLFPSSPACFGSVLGQKWVKREDSILQTINEDKRFRLFSA